MSLVSRFMLSTHTAGPLVAGSHCDYLGYHFVFFPRPGCGSPRFPGHHTPALPPQSSPGTSSGSSQWQHEILLLLSFVARLPLKWQAVFGATLLRKFVLPSPCCFPSGFEAVF